jgi:hypothetical protein
MPDHRELQAQAVASDRAGQQALLRGDAARARTCFRAAADAYRASWEAAPPGSFGRLVGLLKSSILWGDGGHDAGYVRTALGDACDSPTSCYALALAALAQGDDAAALPAIEGMRAGGEPFARTADALHALVHGDGAAYATAIHAIVADFAAREEHLTGVAFADTAVVLERLAKPRGLAVKPASSVMPVLG